MNKGEYPAPPITWKTPWLMWQLLLSGYEPPKWMMRIIAVCAGILILAAVRRLTRTQMNIFVSFTLMPAVFCILIGVILNYRYLLVRYLFFLTLPIAMFVAAGAINIKRYLRIPIVMVLLFFQTTSLVFQYNNHFHRFNLEQGTRPREEMNKAATFVREHWREGDVIGHACVNSVFPFFYYLSFLHRMDPGKVLDLNHEQYQFYVHLYACPEYTAKYEIYDAINIEDVIQDKQRLWFIGSEWDIGADWFNTKFRWKLQSHLISKYKLILSKDFFGAPVYLFDLTESDPPSISHFE